VKKRIYRELLRFSLPIRHSIVKLIAPRLYSEKIEPYRKLPRSMVKKIKKHFGNKSLIGVEIGVSKGIHAENILQVLKIKTLYLVDPYNEYCESETSKFTQRQMDDSCYKGHCRLKPFSDKIVWIQKTSENAVKDIPNDLDFVYIDGNHSYDFVKKDIELYYPKVRTGGFLGGDDFRMQQKDVVKAVIEFVYHRGLLLYGGKPDDWWIIK